MSLILLYLVSGIQFCLYRKIHSSTIYEFYFPWLVHPRPVVTLSVIWYFCILHLTFSLFLQEWGLLLRSLVLMYLLSGINFSCLWSSKCCYKLLLPVMVSCIWYSSCFFLGYSKGLYKVPLPISNNYCSLYLLLAYFDIVQSWYPVSGVCFVFY